jgi:hypothetical protein
MYNPSLRPEWRFNRVLEMVDRPTANPGRSTTRDDIYVKSLRRFILRYRASDDQQARNVLFNENPGLFWAFQFYEHKQDKLDTKATLVEARLLAGQSDEDIATELCTVPEVAEWYEALFFSVRDRLGKHDWVVNEVLYPALTRSLEADAVREQNKSRDQRRTASTFTEPFREATLKFFGYFGGPFVLDFVISRFRRGRMAQSPDEVASYFDDHFKNQIHHHSATGATTFEVNQNNVMNLFNVHCRIMEIAKSNDSLDNQQDAMHRAVGGFLKEVVFVTGDAGAADVGCARASSNGQCMERPHSRLQPPSPSHPTCDLDWDRRQRRDPRRYAATMLSHPLGCAGRLPVARPRIPAPEPAGVDR